MLPEITVDTATCLGPLDCGLCLKTCPMTVFIAGPTKVWKFRETDPKEYQVYARYYDQCVTCLKCVDTCPVECITVNTGTDAPDENDDLDEEPEEQSAEQPVASE